MSGNSDFIIEHGVWADYQGPGGNGVVEIGERAYAKFQWDLIERLL